MGNCGAGQGKLKAKFVPHIGNHGGRKTRSIQLDGEATYRHKVHCPEGHVMKGHVVREMCNVCSGEMTCEKCEENCGDQDSCYLCNDCDMVYCNHCARETLGLPVLKSSSNELVDILPGDVFFAGPDKWGIHHVILARSGWLEPDPEVREVLEIEPGLEVLACNTIESTQGSVGDETWWYPTVTFFTRNPQDGSACIVADLPPGSRTLEQAMNPVAAKVLLHPLRGESQNLELDVAAFEEVVRRAASESKKYGKATAVRSVISALSRSEGQINPDKYGLESDELLDKLKKTWESRPICASVAVKCWQRYFEFTSESVEETVDKILKFIPHWCDKSTPSALIAGLTSRGWVVCDKFNA